MNNAVINVFGELYSIRHTLWFGDGVGEIFKLDGTVNSNNRKGVLTNINIFWAFSLFYGTKKALFSTLLRTCGQL